MQYNISAALLLFLSVILFQNCNKDDDTVSLLSIEDYIAQNNITPNYTPSGLGYVISSTGGTKLAGDSSTVKANVTITTTDNNIRIDTQGDIFLNLLPQIPGLREGIQLVGEGGRITLYVPSALAWGPSGNGSIPGSADVIIEIALADILLNVEEYIEDNSITITDTTDSGVYVFIEEVGDENFPEETDQVVVKYSGYFSNGDEFDANDGLTISLTRVIQGWTEGIPKFSKGGKGKLFIPYEVAYGSTGSGAIPGYTDIIFDIELLDF